MIHKEGFDDDERKLYTALIHSNTIKAIACLLNAMLEDRVPLRNTQLEVGVKKLLILIACIVTLFTLVVRKSISLKILFITESVVTTAIELVISNSTGVK